MTDLTLKRLVPEDPLSWGYWPILEDRVRRALPMLEPEANPDRVIAQLRTFWTMHAGRLGAWIALQPVVRTNGHTPAPIVVAHMVAWADVYWGEPCILIYQLQGEPALGEVQLLIPMMRELEGWRAEMNARAAENQVPQRVDLVRFYTTRPQAFARWFRDVVEVQPGSTIVTFRLSQVTVPSGEM